MTTLENCTEVLLQQKVVQASNYERLESRLMEMERTKRSLFFGLKEIITDVERRRQDLGELRDESTRLQQQLQQGAVKFGVLSAFMGEEQKKSARIREMLENCATAWTGCPARAAHLLRALQERHAFRRLLSDVLTIFHRVRDLVVMVQRVESIRKSVQDRLDEQTRDIEQMNGIVQKIRLKEDRVLEDLQRRVDTARDEGYQLWCNAQQRERLLLLQNATLEASRLKTLGMREYTLVCQATLEEALALSDAHCARRERVSLAAKFTEWRRAHIREGIEVVEAQTHLAADIMSAQVGELDARLQMTVRGSEQAAHEQESLRKVRETTCGTIVALQQRVVALELVRAAMCAFRRQQQVRLLDMHRERAEQEAALTSARAAHEARLFACRLRALQQEAREGLVAEELLTRGSLVNVEDDARDSMMKQYAQEMQVVLLSQCRRQEAEKVVETVDHASRHVTLSKPAMRRSHTTNSAPHNEKKRPRSHAESSTTAPQRVTYPTETQQQQWRKQEECVSPASSASSLGAYLTLGTRLPLSALKASQRSPPLQMISKKLKKNRSDKKDSNRVRERRLNNNSPLPRPPANATCALSHALNSAFAHTRSSTTLAGVTAPSAITRSSPPSQRPRPSVVASAAAAATKVMWGGVKVDDVFADVFSF